MADLELLSIDLINDMYAESRNDDCKYAELLLLLKFTDSKTIHRFQDKREYRRKTMHGKHLDRLSYLHQLQEDNKSNYSN